MPHHGLRGAIIGLLIGFLAASSMYALVSLASSEDILGNALRIYERLYQLSLQGGNVTEAVNALNQALACLNTGNTSCAQLFVAKAASLADKVVVPGGTVYLARAVRAGLALSTPVLLWLLVPWLYAVLWLWSRRNWMLVEERRPLWSLVKQHGLRAALRLYRGIVERHEYSLADPRPPRDFVEFLARPSYSLWLWSVTGIALGAAGLALSNASGSLAGLRLVLGLVYTLFLPGYVLVEALYPREDDLDPVEHLALSIGLSLALVPLLGLALNFTPWRIRSTPVVLTLLVFILSIGLVAAYRKYRLMKLAMGEA